MLCDRKRVVTTSLGIKEVSLKHSGLFHYTNFMMWSSLPLPVFHITESDKFTFSVVPAKPILGWYIFFLSLLQPTQSENTFISSFKICLQSSYFLSLSPQLATTFLIYTTIMFHQECCNNFLVSGFCLYHIWYMLYTSARVILLKHLGDYVNSLLKPPHRLSVSLRVKAEILTMASKGTHHSLTSVSYCLPPPSWDSRHTNFYTVCFFCQKHPLLSFLRDQFLCSPFVPQMSFSQYDPPSPPYLKSQPILLLWLF